MYMYGFLGIYAFLKRSVVETRREEVMAVSQSHRALSRPCDLMKFMLRCLERKATSCSLVLCKGRGEEGGRTVAKYQGKSYG